MTAPERILEMRGIDKSFPGVHALRAVDLDVAPGEIHGLVGENGAGKSTLIKILAGAYSRDAGDIVIGGEAVDAASPNEMIGRGLAVIYQEPSLAPHLSVAENIFMGRLPTRRFGLVDRRTLAEDTALVAERLGLDLDPAAKVGSLSVARRQMVEIAKALSRDARLIVLDEPSAVLADAELDGLIRVMRRLTGKGVAFIYISHRLNEVFRITDRVTVMKDGRVVATERTAEMDPDRLVRLMVGREVLLRVEKPPAQPGEPLLEVIDSLSGSRVAMIGAGGAARAAVWALLKQQASVTLFARDVARARVLAQVFDVSYEPLSSASFAGYDVVINATPLGSGELLDQLPATAEQLDGAHCVYDLVYNPIETRFLEEACKAGCKTIRGLEMLIAQAKIQFELWTGQTPSLNVMSDAAIIALDH